MPFPRLSLPVAAPAVALVAALVLAACGGSHDDDLPFAFTAALGNIQAPVGVAAASGVGLVTVDADRRTLTASVVVDGTVITDAHIHAAVPGSTGAVVFPLAPEAGGTVWATRAPISGAQFAALREGNYYLDVHTAAFPAGELRGQIVWALPDGTQLARLEQASQQSATVELQLHQVDDILDAEDEPFTGIGLGFTVGF